ncbi:hypothetical protein G7046_g2717 [Stylonectria norvegica]|nr:hypothetical protein G7046_g2717 [Stylonectria norvegica]
MPFERAVRGGRHLDVVVGVWHGLVVFFGVEVDEHVLLPFQAGSQVPIVVKLPLEVIEIVEFCGGHNVLTVGELAADAEPVVFVVVVELFPLNVETSDVAVGPEDRDEVMMPDEPLLLEATEVVFVHMAELLKSDELEPVAPDVPEVLTSVDKGLVPVLAVTLVDPAGLYVELLAGKGAEPVDVEETKPVPDGRDVTPVDPEPKVELLTGKGAEPVEPEETGTVSLGRGVAPVGPDVKVELLIGKRTELVELEETNTVPGPSQLKQMKQEQSQIARRSQSQSAEAQYHLPEEYELVPSVTLAVLCIVDEAMPLEPEDMPSVVELEGTGKGGVDVFGGEVESPDEAPDTEEFEGTGKGAPVSFDVEIDRPEEAPGAVELEPVGNGGKVVGGTVMPVPAVGPWEVELDGTGKGGLLAPDVEIGKPEEYPENVVFMLVGKGGGMDGGGGTPVPLVGPLRVMLDGTGKGGIGMPVPVGQTLVEFEGNGNGGKLVSIVNVGFAPDPVEEKAVPLLDVGNGGTPVPEPVPVGPLVVELTGTGNGVPEEPTVVPLEGTGKGGTLVPEGLADGIPAFVPLEPPVGKPERVELCDVGYGAVPEDGTLLKPVPVLIPDRVQVRDEFPAGPCVRDDVPVPPVGPVGIDELLGEYKVVLESTELRIVVMPPEMEVTMGTEDVIVITPELIADEILEVPSSELCDAAVWLMLDMDPEFPVDHQLMVVFEGNGNGGVLAPPVILDDVMFGGSSVPVAVRVEAPGSKDVPPVVLYPVEAPDDVLVRLPPVPLRLVMLMVVGNGIMVGHLLVTMLEVIVGYEKDEFPDAVAPEYVLLEFEGYGGDEAPDSNVDSVEEFSVPVGTTIGPSVSVSVPVTEPLIVVFDQVEENPVLVGADDWPLGPDVKYVEAPWLMLDELFHGISGRDATWIDVPEVALEGIPVEFATVCDGEELAEPVIPGGTELLTAFEEGYVDTVDTLVNGVGVSIDAVAVEDVFPVKELPVTDEAVGPEGLDQVIDPLAAVSENNVPDVRMVPVPVSVADKVVTGEVFEPDDDEELKNPEDGTVDGDEVPDPDKPEVVGVPDTTDDIEDSAPEMEIVELPEAPDVRTGESVSDTMPEDDKELLDAFELTNVGNVSEPVPDNETVLFAPEVGKGGTVADPVPVTDNELFVTLSEEKEGAVLPDTAELFVTPNEDIVPDDSPG